MFKERSYRSWVKTDDLAPFRVVEGETDLHISCDKVLIERARASVLTCRRDIAAYIKKDPLFFSSLKPVEIASDAPEIVKVMGEAASRAGVGPMAAVAGAIAQFVGRDLLRASPQIIIENGGDIFVKTGRPRTLGVFAGDGSPFTGRLAIELPMSDNGYGVCTSSGTVSHSLSFGKADAALIIAESATLADACATAVCNMVKSSSDIEKAIDFARSIDGLGGVLILIGNDMGSWGNIKLL